MSILPGPIACLSKHSKAQRSAAQHSTAQHSTAQHSTTQQNAAHLSTAWLHTTTAYIAVAQSTGHTEGHVALLHVSKPGCLLCIVQSYEYTLAGAYKQGQCLPVTWVEICFSQESCFSQVIGLVNGHHHCQCLAGPGISVSQPTRSEQLCDAWLSAARIHLCIHLQHV